jgi:hypothetical protein
MDNLFKDVDTKYNRSLACFLGAQLADTFGSITEFQIFNPKRSVFKELSWN